MLAAIRGLQLEGQDSVENSNLMLLKAPSDQKPQRAKCPTIRPGVLQYHELTDCRRRGRAPTRTLNERANDSPHSPHLIPRKSTQKKIACLGVMIPTNIATRALENHLNSAKIGINPPALRIVRLKRGHYPRLSLHCSASTVSSNGAGNRPATKSESTTTDRPPRT